jgi:hypothetical protein
MKKRIRLTEQNLHRIVKESVKRILKETVEQGVDPKKFTIAMNKLYSILGEEVGGDDLRESIASWFWCDWDGKSKMVPCKFDDRGMFYLVYNMCNFAVILKAYYVIVTHIANSMIEVCFI